MITNDGQAKILDFGLAKLVEQQRTPVENSSEVATAVMPVHSTPGAIMGTAGYMSPKQAQGKITEIDQRSDIFSFGCILFEAATRRKPFEGDPVIKTLHRLIYEPTPLIRDLNPAAPADLQRIIRRCLAKDKEERYQTIKEVAIELKELRRELETSTGADSTEPQVTAQNWVCHSLNVKGKWAECLEFPERVKRRDDSFYAQLSYANAIGGRRQDAEAILKAVKEREKTTYIGNYWIAATYAALGDKEAAFSHLEKAYQAHDWFRQRLKVDPFIDPLRNDPRFADLIKRIGFPE